MLRAIVFLCSFLLLPLVHTTSASATDSPYLYEILENPSYMQSWNDLLKHEANVPRWLKKFAKTNNGPCFPSWIESIGTTDYRVASVCKAHECGDNRFFVIFRVGEMQAWGLLLENGQPERFFGNPSEELQQLLRNAPSHE